MQHELAILSGAMQRAGHAAIRLAAEGFETFTKQDHSPVTSADLAVNDILRDSLLEAFPEDGWLSEETPDNSERLDKKRVWIVDPIDGTRSFVRGLPEFCLSVALIENGVPMVAAIFNPSTGEFFSAIRGQGMRLDRHPNAGQPPFTPLERPLALVNPWELRVGRFQALEPHMRCRPIGSIAYALALVAAGQADAAVTLEGGNEWDVAAGILLIEENGGRATTASGHPFLFNRPDPRLQGTLALGADVAEPVRAQILQLGMSGFRSRPR
jgi:myo-inositol-1(or 4)-monophosphatase